MGASQAANVLDQIAEEQHKQKNKIWTPEQSAALKKPVIEKFEYESSAYYSAARLWNDGIIDPADTRKVLGLSLKVALKNIESNTKYGVFRM